METIDIHSVQRRLPDGWLMDKLNVYSISRDGEEFRGTVDKFKSGLIIAEAGKWEAKGAHGSQVRTGAVRLYATTNGFVLRRYGKDFLKVVEKRELHTKGTKDALGEFLRMVGSE